MVIFSKSNNLSFISILRRVSSSSCDSEDGICVKTLENSETCLPQHGQCNKNISLKARFSLAHKYKHRAVFN